MAGRGEDCFGEGFGSTRNRCFIYCRLIKLILDGNSVYMVGVTREYSLDEMLLLLVFQPEPADRLLLALFGL